MASKRVFELVTDIIHPESGETLISEDVIRNALNHRSIQRWIYILHDKDVYTEEDEAENPLHKAGTLKPRHYHIVMECSRCNDLSVISKWFGIPENFIKIWKGQGAFLDAITYQFHEHPNQQALGKHLYADAEAHSNFDFRTELTKREEDKLKYGKDLCPKDKMRYDVLYEGKTLRQCMKEDKFLYMEDLDKLKKFRLECIGMQTPPLTRINYYVEGRGGVGKGLICRAIARSLYPQYDNDEDIFFEVGAKGVAFDGYDGQPVIIWNDRRAFDLLQELGSRGNVFNIFDTHPTKQSQNIKYGKVNLCNTVNIVNSVQSHIEFLDGLAGEYTDKFGNLQEVEDKRQSYRRFPFMVVLHEEDYDLLLNKGFVENTDNFGEYLEYKHIRGNMQRIAERCGANIALAKWIQGQAVQPIIDKHNHVLAEMERLVEEEESIKAEFSGYGKYLQPEEQQKEKSDDESGCISMHEPTNSERKKRALADFVTACGVLVGKCDYTENEYDATNTALNMFYDHNPWYHVGDVDYEQAMKYVNGWMKQCKKYLYEGNDLDDEEMVFN